MATQHAHVFEQSTHAGVLPSLFVYLHLVLDSAPPSPVVGIKVLNDIDAAMASRQDDIRTRFVQLF